VERESIGGGVRPPRVTDERNPDCWSARESVRIMFVEGTEVRPSRALEAFWRWEQTFARCTRDMVRDRSQTDTSKLCEGPAWAKRWMGTSWRSSKWCEKSTSGGRQWEVFRACSVAEALPFSELRSWMCKSVV
jgi:hypothetical protein